MSTHVLDVAITTDTVDEHSLTGRTVVVIDVLRATTTMVTALYNGAGSIHAVADAKEVPAVVSRLAGEQILTLGERDGFKMEGFDMGNSPLACTEPCVKGKCLVMTTTNGTRALAKSHRASNVYIAAFSNATAVVDVLKQCGQDVTIICSGHKGNLSMEDSLLAGYLVEQLKSAADAVHHDNSRNDWRLSDSAKTVAALYAVHGPSLLETVFNSSHASRLRAHIGDEEIAYCCTADTCPIVPSFRNGVVSCQKTNH